MTDQQQIRDMFLSAMKEVLGTSMPIKSFQAKNLYPSNPDFEFLQAPFVIDEIRGAVSQLANGKASGPDGLPNEFLKFIGRNFNLKFSISSTNFMQTGLIWVHTTKLKLLWYQNLSAPPRLSISDQSVF